ncbi:MAG: hypothetical protein U5L96_08385 [Owenweeksia sp.]|nr:hypothetical protein [Owenweeksia sp.]
MDFVIESAYNQEFTEEAQALKDRIALDEKQKALRKKEELQQQSDSLILDAGDGLMIIDEKEEPKDTAQTREP